MSTSGAASPGGQEGTAAILERQTEQSVDKPWQTVVWDDPVNLMSYVTFVFRKLFGFSTAKAKELMMQVHNDGKAIVSSGDRDKVEADVRRLHAAGLWATMQRDS